MTASMQAWVMGLHSLLQTTYILIAI